MLTPVLVYPIAIVADALNALPYFVQSQWAATECIAVNSISGKYHHFVHKCSVMYELYAIIRGISRLSHFFFKKFVHY